MRILVPWIQLATYCYVDIHIRCFGRKCHVFLSRTLSMRVVLLFALKAEARRGILSKFLDSFAVDKAFIKIGSRIDKWESGGANMVVHDMANGIRECFDEIEKTFAPVASDLRKAYAVVVAAVVLLSYVYQYLTGCVDWDGSKAESSGSLDYRDTYISIVLFQGAYVWIKFRDVACTKPVPRGAVRTVATQCKYGRIKKKYEPRFKPRMENGVSYSWLYLGRFDAYADAEVMYRMAASCYDYGECYSTPLDLGGDGRELFTIIPEFTPEEQTLSGVDKQELVKERAMELYKRYKTEKDALNLAPTLPGASLEQDLQNGRLQLEVLSERQQKEDHARQIQNLQLQVEILQRHIQDLQQAQEVQVPDLQLETQVQDLQQQQIEAESLTFEEIFDVLLSTEPVPEEAEFGAFINLGDIQPMDETTMRSPADFGDSVYT